MPNGRRFYLFVAVLAAALPAAAQNGPPETAGRISALLPVAHIERGAASPMEVAREDTVLWQDLFSTEAKGRARIAMLDGTAINVGSSARLQILPADDTTQVSELLLQAGKARVWLQEQAGPQEKFRIRTNAALLGIIGTHVYVQAEAGKTSIINISGRVQVRSSSESVAGETTLGRFEAVTVVPGQPPGEKRDATLEEVLQVILETLPGETFRLTPTLARAGECTHALSPQPIPNTLPFGTATQRGCSAPGLNPVRLCLAEDTKAGVREFNVAGPNGKQLWSAFIVLPRPNPQNLVDGSRFFYPPAVPPSSTVTVFLRRDGKPVPNAVVDVTLSGRTVQMVTNQSGSITLRTGEQGAIALAASPSDLLSPVPLPQVTARVSVDPNMKPKDLKVPELAQAGEALLIRDELTQARLNGKELPVAQVIAGSGDFLSSIYIPPAAVEKRTARLEMTDREGNQRAENVSFYDVLAARLDQSQLLSGSVTQGEFLVCIPDPSVSKVKVRIDALGPVRFRGRGGKGERYENRFEVQAGRLLTIPFELQAEKTGTGAPLPFSLSLHLERD